MGEKNRGKCNLAKVGKAQSLYMTCSQDPKISSLNNNTNIIDIKADPKQIVYSSVSYGSASNF